MCLFMGMKLPFLSTIFGIFIFSWAGVSNAHAQAVLRITEVMSNGDVSDWFELTNFGNTPADITGHKMDDSSFSNGASVALFGVTSISPGESVIFIESAAGANVANFKTNWGLGASVQVGYFSGSKVGFSSSGDGVVVFNSSGTEVTPRVSFGAPTIGTTFFVAYTPSGGDLASRTTPPQSASGSLDAFTAPLPNGATTLIGSPGKKQTELSLAFANTPSKYAKTETAYSSSIVFQKVSPTASASLSLVEGPSWLKLSGVTQSGGTLTGTPGQTQTGPQTVILQLTELNQPTVIQTSTITVFNTQPKVVLNEYNAVSGTSLHASLD